MYNRLDEYFLKDQKDTQSAKLNYIQTSLRKNADQSADYIKIKWVLETQTRLLKNADQSADYIYI